MAKYKLISGKHSGIDKDGNAIIYTAGDWIELTSVQAKAFENKVRSEAMLRAEAQMTNAALAGVDNIDELPPVTPEAVQAPTPVKPTVSK